MNAKWWKAAGIRAIKTVAQTANVRNFFSKIHN